MLGEGWVALLPILVFVVERVYAAPFARLLVVIVQEYHTCASAEVVALEEFDEKLVRDHIDNTLRAVSGLEIPEAEGHVQNLS